MSESINTRTNQLSAYRDAKELKALFDATRADLVALRAQLAQLIVDYNANATISTDTTAVAPTLTLLS